MLVAAENQMEDLTRKLMRIRLDNMHGFITNAIALNIDLQTEAVIDLETFENYLTDEGTRIVDVRNRTEYEAAHLKGADNIFVGTLPHNLDKINPSRQTVIHCQSGHRSSIAFSILAKNGFDNVKNFSGGCAEWKAKKGSSKTVGTGD